MRDFVGPFPDLKRWVFRLLLLTFVGACASQPRELESVERLVSLVEQRLSLMDGVARSKWTSGAPIEDLPRERQIISAIGGEASAYGLERAFVEEFFRAQIEASKVIQRARFATWTASRQPPFAQPPDLQREIRPQLDALNPALLHALADAQAALRLPRTSSELSRRIERRREDGAAYAVALAPLRRASAQP
jgi:chorismate mutase